MQDHKVPKYLKISQEIIAQIRKGDLSEGMRIPSENEIIERFGVSNTTARKVLQEVELSGWATRVKGKGTFVHREKLIRSATRILSFTKNMVQAGLEPSTKVLFRGIVKEGYSEVINGRTYTLPGPIFKLHRLRFADKTPMMLEVRYLSLRFCPDIMDKNLEGSLYDVYEKEYGLSLSEVDQMLSAIIIEAGVKEFLDVPDNTPGMLVDGVTFCGKNKVLEMERSIYRGDKYRFAVRAR